MKVLVIGSGGREHAIIWALSKNSRITKLYAAPGNGGIASLAECIPVKAVDVEGIVAFSKENNIDIVIVAPDDPLVLGMVDALDKEGIKAFGPKKAAALIEGSKAFSKILMKENNIPTADFEIFDDRDSAVLYIKKKGAPIVVKADGLALGKGVVVAQTQEEAIEAVDMMMTQKAFGESGNRIIIEECLSGREISVLVFTDGNTIIPMKSAQDHKRIFDGDKGPNTGGMGAYSPSPIYTRELAEECERRIFRPTVDAMNKAGRPFCGVLYFGLMLTEKGIMVIEYNARFGDPEAQAVLPLLKTDLLEIFEAIIDKRLDKINVEWSEESAVCVVMASGGYPKKYITGYEITGTENAGTVFHAGTSILSGKTVTSGGRVLGVTAIGKDLKEARDKAYENVKKISFIDMHYRKDIAD